MYTSVIFDLDGVLVEARDWHYIALNKALKDVSGYEIPYDEHLSIYNGNPTSKKLEMLNDKGVVKKEHFEKIWALKQEKTIETIEECAKPDLEKIELLKYLRANGLKTACVTNSIKETASLMLMKTGQLGLLDCLIANDMIKNHKPHPEGYICAMVAIGVMPSDTVIVEDSPIGLQAARATGARVWQVTCAADVTLQEYKHVFDIA